MGAFLVPWWHRRSLLRALPEAVSKRLRPEWSRREMLFFLWLAGVWFIAAAAFMFVMTIAANVSLWTLGRIKTGSTG